MTEFTIKIADKAVAVRALFESSREYCRDYLCDEKAELSLAITAEDLAHERERTARTDRTDNMSAQHISDAQLEITAIQRRISDELFGYDVLLFHGSAVAVDGIAYLFTAKSGTGKSTHTRLWREILGDRAVMINDDKPFLCVTTEEVLVCGSPWNGKHHLGTNISVPLKAVCVLERGKENQIERISASKALPMLFQQSNRPMNAEWMPKYMQLLDAVAARVDFWKLQCNMEMGAAELSWRAMSGEE